MSQTNLLESYLDQHFSEISRSSWTSLSFIQLGDEFEGDFARLKTVIRKLQEMKKKRNKLLEELDTDMDEDMDMALNDNVDDESLSGSEVRKESSIQDDLLVVDSPVLHNRSLSSKKLKSLMQEMETCLHSTLTPQLQEVSQQHCFSTPSRPSTPTFDPVFSS